MVAAAAAAAQPSQPPPNPQQQMPPMGGPPGGGGPGMPGPMPMMGPPGPMGPMMPGKLVVMQGKRPTSRDASPKEPYDRRRRYFAYYHSHHLVTMVCEIFDLALDGDG